MAAWRRAPRFIGPNGIPQRHSVLPNASIFRSLIGQRTYLTADDTIDLFPEYKSMVPDEPDVLGAEYIRLLKQEIKEQSRLDVEIAGGEQELENMWKTGEPLWAQVKKHVKGDSAGNFIAKAYRNSPEFTVPMMRGVMFKMLKNEKYSQGWDLANQIVRNRVYIPEKIDHLFHIAFAGLTGTDWTSLHLFEHLPRQFRSQKAYHVLLAANAFNRRNRVTMERVFIQLKTRLLYTSTFALNQMLLFHVHPDLRKRIPILLEEAKSAGIPPDVYSYNIYIGAYAKEKNTSGMEEVFQMIKDDQYMEPNESTYIILACGYIAAGRFEEAGKALVELEEKLASGELKRTQSSYNKLLRLYGDTKDKEGVEGIWSILSSRPLKASKETYGYAIEAFGKAVSIQKAEEIFAANDGLVVTSQVLAMLSVYTHHGRMEHAKDLFKHLPRKRMLHRVVVYRYLIDGYLKQGESRKALRMFQLGCTILRERCKSKLWNEVVVKILSYFANLGDTSTIEKIFEANSELKGCIQDIRLYRIMLKAYLVQKAPLRRFVVWISRLGLSLDTETRKLLLELRNPKKI